MQSKSQLDSELTDAFFDNFIAIGAMASDSTITIASGTTNTTDLGAYWDKLKAATNTVNAGRWNGVANKGPRTRLLLAIRLAFQLPDGSLGIKYK